MSTSLATASRPASCSIRTDNLAMDQKIALDDRAERFALLTQTSADTPMGKLLRRFWQPVGLTRKLPAGKARKVRVLSEDLTLYRGVSGKVYLVGGRCAHRLTLLHTGWVEGEYIRCMYHGWQYDGSGRCIEMPAERRAGPPQFSIPSYPVHEYCGIIFAYLGSGQPPAFDLLRKSSFERPNGILFAREETWNCNWFQQVENSLDAVHVSFVHQWGRVGNFGKAVSASIPSLEYLETDAGIRQIATRGENNVRVSDWTFPNCNHIVVPGLQPGDPWIDVGHWVMPGDDATTTRFILYSLPSAGAESDGRISAYFNSVADYNPADDHRALFEDHRAPDDPLLPLTSAQDYVAAMGQGVIADRVNERLGGSDAGVAMLRRIFWREIDHVSAGRNTKTWRPLGETTDLPKQNASSIA
jgi:5,5'-dehydrodivanillate O-demethylase